MTLQLNELEEETTTMQVAMAFDYGQIDEGIRDEVKAAARSIHQLSAGVMTGIVAIGKRLIEVKNMIPHGQFVDWIVGEFQIEPRMAQNYMNVAREYGDPQKRNIISLFSPTVAYLLAAPSTPEVARAEVEQAALNGQKVTVELTKKAVSKFTEPKPMPARAEVKRVVEPYQSPTPTPAKVVYTEPIPTPFDPTLSGRESERAELITAGKAWTPEPIDEAQPLTDEQVAAQIAELEAQWTEPELAAHAIENEAFWKTHPRPQADLRLAQAIALRDGLQSVRDLARADYHALTGMDTDLLEFERGIAKMLPRLASLIDTLESCIGQP